MAIRLLIIQEIDFTYKAHQSIIEIAILSFSNAFTIYELKHPLDLFPVFPSLPRYSPQSYLSPQNTFFSAHQTTEQHDPLHQNPPANTQSILTDKKNQLIFLLNLLTPHPPIQHTRPQTSEQAPSHNHSTTTTYRELIIE